MYIGHMVVISTRLFSRISRIFHSALLSTYLFLEFGKCLLIIFLFCFTRTSIIFLVQIHYAIHTISFFSLERFFIGQIFPVYVLTDMFTIISFNLFLKLNVNQINLWYSDCEHPRSISLVPTLNFKTDVLILKYYVYQRIPFL